MARAPRRQAIIRVPSLILMLTIGQKAPDFSAPDQYGKIRTLGEFKGSWLVLYFYPKDGTDGCTTEACELRDSMNDLRGLGFAVVGVSADDETSHKKFSERYALSFPLLADTEKKIIEAYGVWGEKTAPGKTYMGILRTTFLIDPDGVIRKVYEKVKPEGHAEELLADIKAMKIEK
jgi:thioredoxin-dependent peroxiredoxin